jgi:glucose-6-phosphate dehydrogenase assembly protein OpcA
LTANDCLRRIEAELEALWSPEASPSGSWAPGKARACTLNLVAVGSLDSSGDFLQVVDRVSADLAARTLIVSVDPAAPPDSLTGEVSAVCRAEPGRGQKAVCAERVELVLGRGMAERARSVVDALVQSRLPTVLYVGRGANPSAVDALAQVATRLVVDSAEHGVSRSHALARMTTAHLVDMAFLRGRRWREMLARFFDDPSLLPALRDVRSLEVTTFGPAAGHGRADAELVIGWLGSRLGWTLESGAFLGPSGAGVDVQLQVSTEERAGGPVLSSVTLKAELDGAPLVGRVVREDDEHLKWTLESGRAPALCRHFPVPRRDESELIVRAVSDVRSDAHTREALELARAFRGDA